MKQLSYLTALLLFSVNLVAAYPAHWWKPVPEDQRKGSWEILPQQARPGEVILSKRNELGLFSNLAPSPFEFEGVTYASVEALWQMMKYPNLNYPSDPRLLFASEFPYTRDQVIALSGFESKKAGSIANKILKKHNVNLVSYGKTFFNYRDFGPGSMIHYHIISRAIREKVYQNPALIKLLRSTKGLILRPDHTMSKQRPKSYNYFDILMEIRKEL